MHWLGKHIMLDKVGLPTPIPAGPSFALPSGALTLTQPVIPPPVVTNVTASSQARAQRRLLEMQARGEKASLEELEQAILARDHTDSTRAFAPLKKAEDAMELDTTQMSAQQAIEAVLRAIRQVQEGLPCSI